MSLLITHPLALSAINCMQKNVPTSMHALGDQTHEIDLDRHADYLPTKPVQAIGEILSPINDMANKQYQVPGTRYGGYHTSTVRAWR